MSNPIEDGTQRPTEQEEIRDSCREIFITAIKLLETKGQPAANDFNRYQLFQHFVANPRQEAVNVRIVAGENLAKARKVSVYVGGVGRLDVRKTGVKGQEKYKGKEFNEYSIRRGYSGHSQDLDGRNSFHILVVRGYLKDIRRVSTEIMPQSH